MSDDPVTPTATAEAGPPRHRFARRLLPVLVALVLAGAGVGTAVAVSGGSDNTPAQAVTSLLTAVHNDDVVGMLAALDPGERAALQPGVTELVDQLKRLRVLSPNADLSKVSGLDFSFTKITTATTYLRSDVAAVRITGGAGTATVNPDELPLGSFVTSLAGNALRAIGPKTSTSSAASKTAIATVDVGGQWYVSLGYTIAINDAKNVQTPPASEAVPAIGAASATGAVQALFRAVADFDLRAIIEDTPSDEMAALHAYAPLFLAKAQTSLGRVASLAHVTFTSMHLVASPLGDATLVKVSDLGITVVVDGIKITYSNGCLRLQTFASSRHVCPTRNARAFESLPPTVRALLGPLIAPHARANLGFVTVDEGGKWLVSPTRTLLQSMDAGLAVLRPQDLAAIEGIVRYAMANPKALSKLGSHVASGAVSSLTGLPAN